MRQYLRRKFLNWLVKDLFVAYDENDILVIYPDNSMKFEGKQMVDERVVGLQEDASAMLNSFLWKVLSADIKYNATRTMFDKSKNYEGMMFGKATLYVLDVIKKRLEQLAGLKK